MTEKLEKKANSYKRKGWEMTVPVIGTVAYYMRCSKDTILTGYSPDIERSNNVMVRISGLITKDVFLASAAAMTYLFMK